MKLYYILLVFVVCGVMGQSKPETDETINEVEDNGNWKLLYRLFVDCAKTQDVSVCLKMKAVTFMDRAVSLKIPLMINDYISLARDPAYKEGPQGRSMQPLSETQLDESLPKSAEERGERLDELLQEKLNSFLQSRTLQLNFPADIFEGRKRKKGGGYLLAAGAAMAAMMAQMFMGKIALIAGKALLVAKIALVLSAIVGLKKLFGSSGGGESHPQVVYASGGHEHGMWQGRGISSDPLLAHDMAYRAHKTENASDN
ncbi:hypothetical protein L798_05229 [Zootermopsis nevadensis]|uniref:Osiris 21 n=2 Tax=Zootermopsis nevadensis TaxID=136037 RepID=A0A067RHW8_ZOONE|nr:hypothetical protein L798_05229 [Zootermopsis nevadensis]